MVFIQSKVGVAADHVTQPDFMLGDDSEIPIGYTIKLTRRASN
jgi:hypothetical protein